MNGTIYVMIAHIREATCEDVLACYAIEAACFPPGEAASQQNIRTRATLFPAGFLVAEHEGKIIGFVNSGASNQDDLADEALKDMVGHDSAGRNLIVFSVAVRPAMQAQGVATQLLRAFIEQARRLGKESILLLCKAHLVGFYERAGFRDEGLSNSLHGGARWHQMRLKL
jgi:ribosomal protein S18 acetylase RimI-like enzyme